MMTSNAPRLDSLEQNQIINGNFDFAQRRASATFNNGGNGYVADRFQVFNGAGVTAQTTYSLSANVPTTAQSGFTSAQSLLVTVNTPNTVSTGGYQLIKYAVEGYDYQRLHGQAARLTFWVRSSIAGTYAVSFSQTAGGRSYVAPFTQNVANTWEKKTIDLVFDTSASGYTFDNSSSLQILWCMDAGATNQTSSVNQWINGTFYGSTSQTHWLATGGATFQLAQVMLTINNYSNTASGVDLPFQRAGKTVGHELQLCQRYCFTRGGNSPTLSHAVLTSANAANFIINWPVIMRAAPTASSSGANWTLNTWNGGANISSGTVAVNGTDIYSAYCTLTGSGGGGTAPGSGNIFGANSSALFIADAEI